MKTKRTLTDNSILSVEKTTDSFEKECYIAKIDGKDFPDNLEYDTSKNIEDVADHFEMWMEDNLQS